MRADAARNRAKLLLVAERLFMSKGPVVEMDEIAAAAGLGVGTIYRHFATKEALLEAIVVAPIEALIDEARAMSKAPEPGAAFYLLLEKLVELATAKHHLIAAFARAGHSPPVGAPDEVASRSDRFAEAFGRLLARAQRAGAVRRDVRVPELVAIVNGAFPYLGSDTAARRRLLALIKDALAGD